MRPLINVTSILSINATLENSTARHLHSQPDLSLYQPRILLNDTVYAKARKVMLDYPSVAFRELQLTSTIGPTTDPELLLNVRLLFSDRFGTLFMDMTDTWGDWGPLRFLGKPFPGGYNILPARLGMDIVLADRLKKRAGYLGPYEAVDVKWPSGLQVWKNQPYYCFLMEGNQPDFVYVGVNDGSVMTSLPTIGEGSDNDGTTTA